MQRLSCQPRQDWAARVESLGFTFHSHETDPYWDESACYEFTLPEILTLESAAAQAHQLCIDAAEQVILRQWWDRLRIPPSAVPLILQSWERDDFSLYGRFDFAFDGTQPKLLEYNADTPTALIEASVVQWFWLRETHPQCDQFNSLHERLIEAWRPWQGRTVHFTSVRENPEDEQTVTYLRDTCLQAGVHTEFVYIDDIGWQKENQRFVDLDSKPIESCFKLYPWEWIVHEEFAPLLQSEPIRFIEPAWKMLLSNKGLLPVLWELFPNHPLLLPAYTEPDRLDGSFVRKPILSREGSNIRWVENSRVLEERDGPYGEEGFIYQTPASLPDFQGNHPVLGLWIVNHEAAGLGVREDSSRITGNFSRFVPHFIRPS